MYHISLNWSFFVNFRMFPNSPLKLTVWKIIWKWKLLSRVQLFATPWLYSPWNSPGQNTGVNSLSLLQGTFPTQGSNPGLERILFWTLIFLPYNYIAFWFKVVFPTFIHLSHSDLAGWPWYFQTFKISRKRFCRVAICPGFHLISQLNDWEYPCSFILLKYSGYDHLVIDHHWE